ncbi:lytic murein transglycosylase [Gordonia sp. CPCC 205333]|uniref:lytic murein transglycosylase n=1 Tax=Gordonia sp. CPCC 205333 TaxID=3140790 RepID=UPI003AF36844
MRKAMGVMGVLLAVVLVAGCSSRLSKDEDSAKQDVPSVQLRAWSQLHSEPYGIPVRALQSYAYAAAAMDKAVPGCGIGWSTLAAIGAVASEHGSADGSSIGNDGIVSPQLRGLTQANPERAKPIPDTDAGRYDGNDTIDVTMGPMQIMPSKWEQFATDADNDGKADPDNFDDATLTVARYLCAAGGDLRKSDGWAASVAQFNSTPGFLEKVHAFAGRYGR